MEKGQTALEFIFIILIIIIYIYTATLPLISNGQGAIEDIENISKSNYETKRILNSINKLSLLGTNSKETLKLEIPTNSEIICDSNKIGFRSTINVTGNNPSITICENNICDKNYSVNSVNFTCTSNTFTGIQPVILVRTTTGLILSEGS